MSVATISPLLLTTCQENALDKLEREGNIFLTGAAGTGKSFLLDRYLREKPSQLFPIVASTGAAAVLIGGRTFHSFFGLGIMEGGVDAAVTRALKNRKLLNRLQAAQCVVIDEVSMLSGSTLSAAEQISRRARNPHLPWGGLRIIAVGDFAQLPPVTMYGQEKDWAFLHNVWNESQFHPALLSTVMRTQESEFLTILNFIRQGIVNEQVEAFLNKKLVQDFEQTEGTRLYSHRNKAEAYNLHRLEELPRRVFEFPTQFSGDDRYLDSARKSLPIPDTLYLKEGALVMMRKNDVSFERLYVNGSLGHVVSIGEDELSVHLLSGVTIDVKKEKFSYLDGDGNELVSAWNFPVSLAWATTIHKAQGASLDRMTVDLSALWEPGQAYVALSRVRSADGLFIERWTKQSIRAEPLVTSLYNSLAEQSKDYVPRPFFTVREIDHAEEESPSTVSLSKAKKIALVKQELAAKSPLPQIALTAGIKTDRVLLYLEELLDSGESLSLSYLLHDLDEVTRIRNAFEERGTDRLKPVYEALHEEIPFSTLRLVRCVMLAENANS